MKFKTLLLIILSMIFYVGASDKFRYPVAPVLNYDALSAVAHTSFAADLGRYSEGKVSYAFSGQGQQSFALSTPFFQVISAKENNYRFFETDSGYSKALSTKLQAHELNYYGSGSPEYTREFFSIGTGVGLSQAGIKLPVDLTLGFQLDRRILTYEGDVVEERTDPAYSGNLIMNKTLLGVRYRDDVSTLRLAYENPGDKQIGVMVNWFPDIERSFEIRVGGEKIFVNSIAARAQFRSKYTSLKEVDRLIVMGTSIRFRPWIQGVDPGWIEKIVSPIQNKRMAKYLYDTEIGADIIVDYMNGQSSTSFTLGRWF
jgi:hypothetical protein